MSRTSSHTRSRHANGHSRSRRPSRRGVVLTCLVLLPAVILSACKVGPNYKQPDTHVPEQYEGAGVDASVAPLSKPTPSEAELSTWWTQFQDPELESLVKRAMQSNLDLQTAASRIRQSREQELIAGAAELPSVSATGNAARLHANSNPLAGLASGQSSGSQAGGNSGGPTGGNGGSGSSSSGSTTLNLYSVGFDATWEADLFGGTARGIEAAKANTEASVWQWRDAQVSLVAEVANGYLTLRTLQARLTLIEASAKHQQTLLDLASARAKAGFVTELDVNQQRTQLASTVAQIPTLQAQLRAQVHALSVLLGLEPDALTAELTAATASPTVPDSLPVGLPSQLLRRRPDVRKAERQLASATAEVGVAVADLYPKFNLIGALTLSSTTPGQLFQGRSLNNLALAMISWPVFEGGKVRANIRASEEQRQQAYLGYKKSVLTALQDAEDALVRYDAEQRRLVSLRQSEAAAASSQHIAEEQYRTGMVTFINVLTATTTELNAQDQVQQSTQALAQDLVSVYKALGGGWSTESP